VSDLDGVDYELEKDAIALFQTADDLYTHEQYRVKNILSLRQMISGRASG